MLVDARARRLRGDPQGRGELAVVDLMILWAKDCARELAGEMGLAPPRLGGGDPLQRQIELLLESEIVQDFGLVIALTADDQAKILHNLAFQQKLDCAGFWL